MSKPDDPFRIEIQRTNAGGMYLVLWAERKETLDRLFKEVSGSALVPSDSEVISSSFKDPDVKGVQAPWHRTAIRLRETSSTSPFKLGLWVTTLLRTADV